MEQFEHQKQCVSFDVPTYLLQDDQYFVLGRNRRLVALTLASAIPRHLLVKNIADN